jgi:hypothetical protein
LSTCKIDFYNSLQSYLASIRITIPTRYFGFQKK